MTAKRPLKSTTLRTAGIVAMISAVVTLPVFALSIQFEGQHDQTARTMQIIMQCAGMVAFMALTVSLRCFLDWNCAFKKANKIIHCLIVLNLVYAVVSCAGLLIPKAEEQLQPIILALIILLGAAQAGLGIRLFDLENDLGGMKRPFCWLNIITGISLASLLLIPVGVITSAVADVMLATIFLQEARRLSILPGTDGKACG